MKYLAILSLAVGAVQAAVQGFDISHYQPNVNFAAAHSAGARFVIIKATEGITYTDPKFSAHYTGATKAGFIRGGYHFARPAASTGAVQASYFVAHGGGWSGDGITLPGMLDLEAGCSGKTTTQMVAWIKSFVDKYKSLTGRYPMIYTGSSWWVTCTGNSHSFSANSPLVLAHYSAVAGAPPGGWPYYTIWQYNDHYTYGGDSDTFNGPLSQLVKLARG